MNKRAEAVRYQPFRANPLLAEGLLEVARPDGDTERQVANAFARLASSTGQIADELAAFEGERSGVRDALANTPQPASIAGGVSAPTMATSPLAYAGNEEADPVASADLSKRARYVYNGLRQRGLSHVAAAAAVGHARQESAIRADGPDGDKGTSSGLFQWRNERRSALKGFAGQRNWRDTDVQLDFFVHELKTRERLASKGLEGAQTIEQATEALMHFERPQHYTARNPRAGHGWANRLSYAGWADSFRGEEPSAVTALAPEPAPSSAAAAIKSVAPISAASVEAPAIVPATVEPARITGSGAGGFRPTGSFTIRGKAYDAAGTRTYLEQLDTTMRADVDEVYDRFGEDPVALKGAFSALRTLHLDEEEGHVFPEIRAQYETAFASMTRPYVRQAEADAERRVLVANRADFLQRTQDLETIQARELETFDPDSEDAAAAIASSQAAIDAHFDSAVARGILDADDAVAAKASSRREAAVRFYTRQAETAATPEAIVELRESMRRDFTAGTLEGIDGAGWTALDTELGRAAESMRIRDAAAAKSLEQRGDLFAETILDGFDVGSEEIGRFLLDRNTVPGGPAIVDRAMDRVAAARILRDGTLAEAETFVRGLERDAGATRNGTAGFARTALDRLRRDVMRDPIGVAERRDLLPAEEGRLSDPGTPDQLSARMRSRIGRAELAAAHFGVPVQYLKPDEARELRALAEQDPATAVGLAAGIVAGAGGRAGSVLHELGRDAPAMMQAGVILAGGGSPEAAEDVLLGHGRGADGKALPQVLDNTRRQRVAADVLGTAFVGSPRDATRTIEAGHAIARARIASLGVDPKSDEASVILERGLQEAAGAVFDGEIQYGGVTDYRTGGFLGFGAARFKVAVPPSIRADRFADVVEAIRDQDLVDDGRGGRRGRSHMSALPQREDGRPYTAAEIKGARPVAVYGGYRFAVGDPASQDPQWIRGSDGAPFVLALDGMRQILEPRVPGAFR